MKPRPLRTGVLLRPWVTPQVRPAALAREAGVSRQYVSSVLAGLRPPSRKLLAAAQRLGIPVETIYPSQ